jgi:hypothetical protein
MFESKPCPDKRVKYPIGTYMKVSFKKSQVLIGAEIQKLQELLDSRLNAIISLTKILEEKEEANLEKIERVEQELFDVRKKYQVKLKLATIAQRIFYEGHEVSMPPIVQQVIHVSTSRLFDLDWYLKGSPNFEKLQFFALGDTKILAAEHYVRIGCYEGRDPGPEFNTLDYYSSNEDVLTEGWPALLHYELFGRLENRPLLAKKLEDTRQFLDSRKA